ncbi:MAG TPA: hypothetical protein VJU61_02655, partial [Polyangiaceae bacterium]|nr:hypothetical protein [Polyangiaceae bacterium]
IADDRIYAIEASGSIGQYSFGGERLGEVSLVGGASPLSCDLLEARGSALYCANGRGVFRSVELSSDWLALGTSAEFLASGLAVGNTYIYWTTSALQRAPLGGGTTEQLGSSFPSGLDLLGDRVFFASNPGGVSGVYEYSEGGELVSYLSQFTRDVAVVPAGLYALDALGELEWRAFASEAPSVVEPEEANVQEVEADSTGVYYIESSRIDDPDTWSRIVRRTRL